MTVAALISSNLQLTVLTIKGLFSCKSASVITLTGRTVWREDDIDICVIHHVKSAESSILCGAIRDVVVYTESEKERLRRSLKIK